MGRLWVGPPKCRGKCRGDKVVGYASVADPGLGFGPRQSAFPLVRPWQSTQSAGKAVSPRRPIKRQSGLFWAAKCCFWPRTSHFLGGVLAQFWPWFRAIYRRFLAMVWSQIGNFSPAARLLSGVPPEPPRQTCYPIGGGAKKRRKTAGHPAVCKNFSLLITEIQQ